MAKEFFEKLGNYFFNANLDEKELSEFVIDTKKDKSFVRKEPNTIEKEIHCNFSKQYTLKTKTMRLYLLNEAKIIGKDLITEKDYFVGADIPCINRKKIVPNVKKKTFSSVKKLKSGLYLYPADNYFHWMVEVIPRLRLINKKHKFDYVVVPQDKKFQKETIDYIFPNEKKAILDKKSFYNIKKLFVPSMPAYSGNPSKENCLFLRKKFLKNKKKNKEYEKIYVVRGRPKNGRVVINEKEVINCLEKKGFKAVSMDNISVFEQAKIFNSAKMIIAPHGAALTNLVFCEKATKVLEFFNPKYVNVCYWAISNCINLDYYYFLAESRNFTNSLKVNIEKLEKSITLMGF